MGGAVGPPLSSPSTKETQQHHHHHLFVKCEPKRMMDALNSSFLILCPFYKYPKSKYSKSKRPMIIVSSSVTPDPWTLSDGNNNNNVEKAKARSKNPKNPLSDDNARRIIKAKAQYLSVLRRNQGPRAQTPKWIKRTPQQMVQYLEDDRNGHLYGRHVVAAIKRVRTLSEKPQGGGGGSSSYDMREVMRSFVAKLTFSEMCIVLKEQKGWRQVRDFFAWMKLQLGYRPSVIVYTILLRMYGQVGKIKLAEQTFLEMLETGCEPDEVACGTMLCAYARWGRLKAMLSFYSAVQERGLTLSVSVYNFMLSALQKKSLHENVIEIWRQMADKGVLPNHFSYTVVISSLVKGGLSEEAFKTFYEMKSGFVPEEVTYSLLISLSSKKGNQDEALRLYEDMRLQRIIPSNFTCASLLTLHYKNEDYSKALSLFAEMERYKIVVDEVIYGLLIRIYGKLGLYEDAQRTFGEIDKLGLLTDEKTYTTMAQVHVNSGNFEKALGILEQMKSKNIWFSRFAFIVSLQCYVLKEDLASAEAAFQALLKIGPLDSICCKKMLNFYLKLGLTEKAKDFVIHIRKDQVEFDDQLLKAVMKVYCTEGMVRDAEQLIDKISRNRSFVDSKFFQTFAMAMDGDTRGLEGTKGAFEPLPQPDAMAIGLVLRLYLTDGNGKGAEEKLKLLLQIANGLSVASQLIVKFIREGDISKAQYLYELLIHLRCKPEDDASASMISLYGKQHKLKRAQDVFAVVADSFTNKKLLYKSMIDACIKCAKPEEAYLFYRKETEKGHDLGAVAISMLVNALTNCGKYREAEDVIRNSFLGNLELDTVAYNTFIKAMLEAGKLHFATGIYERMLSSGTALTVQTFSTMISVYGRGRNLNKAVGMLNMAQSMGVSFDEKAYTNLICYYGKAGKIQDASLLFRKMQEEAIKPGKVSYNNMINICATAGLYSQAEEHFHAMQRGGCSPDSYTYLALVRSYTEGLKYSEAEKAIVSMQREGIPPSCAHFNLLLLAFAKAGLIREAERVYMELMTVGLSPDLECHRNMLRGYMDYGHVEAGISLFERIHGSVEPDRFIMSAAVHFYKSAGMVLRAKDVLNTLNTLGIPFLKNLQVGSKTR